MANNAPAYQTYPNDFITSTNCRTMKLDEYGLYKWLLDYSFAQTPQCFLLNDKKIMAKLVGTTSRKFGKCWLVVSKMFETTEGNIIPSKEEIIEEITSEKKYKGSKQELYRQKLI